MTNLSREIKYNPTSFLSGLVKVLRISNFSIASLGAIVNRSLIDADDGYPCAKLFETLVCIMYLEGTPELVARVVAGYFLHSMLILVKGGDSGDL